MSGVTPRYAFSLTCRFGPGDATALHSGCDYFVGGFVAEGLGFVMLGWVGYAKKDSHESIVEGEGGSEGRGLSIAVLHREA